MRLIPPSAPARGDAGFTLVELLIAISILSVISLALGSVVIGFVKNTDTTTDRLMLSHDAQLSTAYVGSDIASLGTRDRTSSTQGSPPFTPSVQLGASFTAGGYTCGTSATPVALVRLLSDDWDEAKAVSTDVVAYYLKPMGADSQGFRISELHRLKCIGSTTLPPCELPSSRVCDVTIAHFVYSGLGPAGPRQPPVITCSSTCDSAAVPQQVTLTFWVTRPSADPYQVTLTGQRRQT